MATKKTHELAGGVFPDMGRADVDAPRTAPQVEAERGVVINPSAAIPKANEPDAEVIRLRAVLKRHQEQLLEVGAKLAAIEQAALLQPKISGYRELTESELRWINRLKSWGRDGRHCVDDLQRIEAFDARDIADGAAHIRLGLMLLVRAVARPTEW